MMQTSIMFLLFPGMLQLDFTGPYGVLRTHPTTQIHLTWKTTTPILTSDKLILTPTIPLEHCPDCDVICIPGGEGIIPLLEDDQILQFLFEKSQRARFVTSVCTGSLILGAAGLLQGYCATTHWRAFDLLSQFDVIPTNKRVVIDRNRITAAGVTSGIDLAFTLAAKLWGQQQAEKMQLAMQYAPEPPFNCGNPENAHQGFLTQ